MSEVWDQTEQIYEGWEVAEATVDDEVSYRTPKVPKGGLELGLRVLEFDEVDFEDAEGFKVSEIGESFENALVLGFVRRRVPQPPDVCRQNPRSFLFDILAPPLELRLELETDVVKQMALAPWKPRFGNESAGFEVSAEVAVGCLSSVVDDLVDNFLVVVEHDVRHGGFSGAGAGRHRR
jgi:hypothetical protein